MKKVELKGIITPILTPMKEDESINTEELRNQIERLIDGGVHGIFPFGTNGEGYILSEAEKVEVLETTIDQVKEEFLYMLVLDVSQQLILSE